MAEPDKPLAGESHYAVLQPAGIVHPQLLLHTARACTHACLRALPLYSTFPPKHTQPARPAQIAKAVIDGERLQVPSPDQLPGAREPFEALGGYLSLMHACWAQDAADRPTFGQIITKLK